MQGDAELEIACTSGAFEELKERAEKQFRLLGLNTRVLSREQFAERYFDCPRMHGAAAQRPTFGLHPLRYALGLAVAAEQRGAQLHAMSEVIEWRKEGDTHLLTTESGTVRAKTVVLATNGFTPEHLYDGIRARTLPVISAIVVTRPLSDDELAAHGWQTESPAFTSYDLLNYFRILPDRRFLFGGRGSSSGDPEGTVRNFVSLTNQFRKLFPHWREIEIDYQWHGLICLTRRLTPAIGTMPDDPSVFFGYGFHGNGINNATWSGRQIADWIGSASPDGAGFAESLPAVVRGLPARFPFPSLRIRYVQARIAMFRVTDWLR